MVEQMLGKTAEILKQEIEKRRNEVKNISKKAADLWEGDQWHSTTFREQQRQKELAIRYLQQASSKAESIEILSPPNQDNFVELGHMVKLKFLNDRETLKKQMAYVLVHVFTPTDVQYLGKLFDNDGERIISQNSPLGKSLIGAKRGQTLIYHNGLSAQLLEDEDAIRSSSLFNLPKEGV